MQLSSVEYLFFRSVYCRANISAKKRGYRRKAYAQDAGAKRRLPCELAGETCLAVLCFGTCSSFFMTWTLRVAPAPNKRPLQPSIHFIPSLSNPRRSHALPPSRAPKTLLPSDLHSINFPHCAVMSPFRRCRCRPGPYDGSIAGGPPRKGPDANKCESRNVVRSEML